MEKNVKNNNNNTRIVKVKKVFKVGILISAALVTAALVFSFNANKNLVQVTEEGTTICGMYVDPNSTFEVREDMLVEIDKEGNEVLIMKLDSKQIKSLEKYNKRGFVLDLEK